MEGIGRSIRIDRAGRSWPISFVRDHGAIVVNRHLNTFAASLFESCLCRYPVRHLVVSSPTERAPGQIFANTAPLLEEERNILLSAFTEDFSNPLDFHRPCTETRFAADD